jgi:hypothetical protein
MVERYVMRVGAFRHSGRVAIVASELPIYDMPACPMDMDGRTS